MLGRAGLGGGKQGWVMDWKVTVVVLYDGQSCPLNTGKEDKGESKGSSGHRKCLSLKFR